MKVHIIGAGPAGSIAAMSALRSNFEPIISEDHPRSGIPENCSGLFSKDGLDSLKDFVDYQKTIINPINGADVYIGEHKLEIRKKSPIAFVCNRSELDQTLATNANREGVKIRYNERVTDVFQAKNIIGTDGPTSQIATQFGFPKITKYASTLQTHIRYKSEDPHAVEVYISNERFPGFFAWIIPHNEEMAEFGVGVEMPYKSIDAWNRLLKMKSITDAPKPRGWAIPIKTRRKTSIVKNGYKVLLAGDAAGQVKATTGGGVIFGGNCAAVAGKWADNPTRYDIEWKLRFGADLKSHHLVHDYLAKMSESQINSLGRRLKNLKIDQYLSENGNMDKPTKMIKPQFLIHLLKNLSGF
ncbi:MAG: hypothetical protein ACP5N9_03865 [Candidatus Bilamarchaeum sp.]|jgi:flavin-dependent dehydrogenase